MKNRHLKAECLVLAVSVAFLFVYFVSNNLKPNETVIGDTTIESGSTSTQKTGPATPRQTTAPSGYPSTTVPTTSSGAVSIHDLSRLALFTLIFTLFGAAGGFAVGCFLGSRCTDVVSTHEKQLKIDIEDTIIGYITRQGEFTIPGIAVVAKASERQVNNVVKNLIKQRVVRLTEKVWPEAGGSAQVYEYMGG
ncbi:MAG: hypothetical protein AB1305_03245 [Candidatus Hadarchaeota archaeon]